MKHRLRRRRGLCAGLTAAALLALAFLDSAQRLVTTEYEISSARLPQSFDGFRIVQLSDLHAAQFGTDNARLLRAVAAAEPDLIALTGDLIEKAADIPAAAALARRLTELAPVYFVSGNHDWASHAMAALFAALEAAGVLCLRNESAALPRAGGSILLVGVEDPNGPADMEKPPAVVAAAQNGAPETFTVLLAHRNDWVTRYPALPVDVILCGHAHGGVVRLPGVGGLLGADRSLFPDYTEGVTACGRYRMVVSRGLGQATPLLRLGNRPEIVCLTLRTAG